MKQLTASVISNTEVMPGINLVWLDAGEIASEAKPGQFVMVDCGGDTTLPRPISIHQSDGSKIAILFKAVGKGTNLLSRVKAGDSQNVFGPCGNGFSIFPTSKNLLMVAGGVGIAPLYFLAQESLKLNRTIKLLIGGATAAMCFPQRLLPDEIDIIYMTDDATLGKQGRITTIIPDYFEWADQIFACGPLPMYRHMADNFPQRKDKHTQVSLEVRMACGRGVCNGCTIKTKSGLKKVCEQGPVFSLQDVNWDELSPG